MAWYCPIFWRASSSTRPWSSDQPESAALLLEGLYGALADLFEKEQAEIPSREWAQHAWLDDVVVGLRRRDLVDRVLALALAAKARVQIVC